MAMVTSKFPCVEIAPNTYEIDEFDCCSLFLIVGTERALVIDTGVGVGDFRGFVESITTKPYDVVMTHGHTDHMGGAGFFDTLYMHRADWGIFPFPPTVAQRTFTTILLSSGRTGLSYPYNLDADVREWPIMPRVKPLEDGQQFPLGGRTVTAYHTPGHTPGCMMFIDDQSRILFTGDSCNCNFRLFHELGAADFVSIQRAHAAFQRVLALEGVAYDADKAFNQHHDYRPFGGGLDPRVMHWAAEALAGLVDGTTQPEMIPDPLFPNGDKKEAVVCGSVMVFFNRDGIFDPK